MAHEALKRSYELKQVQIKSNLALIKQLEEELERARKGTGNKERDVLRSLQAEMTVNVEGNRSTKMSNPTPGFDQQFRSPPEQALSPVLDVETRNQALL